MPAAECRSDPLRSSKLAVRLQLGDCQALAATPGAFHPLWNDAHGSLQLYTAAVSARSPRALWAAGR
jgi:hypothetical protein